MANGTTSHGGEHPTVNSLPWGNAGRSAGAGQRVRRDVRRADGVRGLRAARPLGRKISKVEKIFVNGRGEPEYIVAKIEDIQGP